MEEEKRNAKFIDIGVAKVRRKEIESVQRIYGYGDQCVVVRMRSGSSFEVCEIHKQAYKSLLEFART